MKHKSGSYEIQVNKLGEYRVVRWFRDSEGWETFDICAQGITDISSARETLNTILKNNELVKSANTWETVEVS